MSYWQRTQAEKREPTKVPKKTAKKKAKKAEPLPDDLSEMSLKDLKSLAVEMDVPGRSSMNKKQLVKVLS